MKLRVGPVLTEIQAPYWEIQEVAQRLRLPADLECEFVSPAGEIFSGLVPLVLAMFPGTEIEYQEPLEPVPELWDDELVQSLPGIELRDYQALAVHKLLDARRGVVECPTGSGKTEIAIAAVKPLLARGHRVLFCCGSLFITEQAALRFQRYGITDVGVCTGDRWELGHQVTCATVQTLCQGVKCQDEETLALLRECEVLVADEVHHVPAATSVTVLSAARAKWRFGFSATVFEELDEYVPRDLLLIGLLGPPVLYIPLHGLVEQGVLPTPFVLLSVVAQTTEPVPAGAGWDEVYPLCVTRNGVRNVQVQQITRACLDRGLKPLVFVNQVEGHGQRLLPWLWEVSPDAIFVTGNREVYTLAGGEVPEVWSLERLREYVQTRERAVVLASPALDEGVDIPEFSAVVLAAGGKKARRVLQRLGRGMRKRCEGDVLYVFDFYDATHYMVERHSQRRLRLYQRERIRVCSYHDWLRERDPWKLPVIRLM